jgi:hypothetical protein
MPGIRVGILQKDIKQIGEVEQKPMTIDELKVALKAAGLPVSGTKAVLQERLRAIPEEKVSYDCCIAMIQTLSRYNNLITMPPLDLLVIDEIGYLSYSNRHADLLFELVSRRYESKSTMVTTNKAFADWSTVFPNAACVVSLIDRLVHHSEVIPIEGESYRLKEALERAEQAESKRKKVKS